MVTTTQRKKLSIGTKVFLGFLIVSVIIIIVCATIGIIDLSWAGNGFLGLYVAVSQDLVLAVLLSFGWISLGMLLIYAYFTYIRGNKVTTTAQSQGYNPIPTTPAQTQKDTETVIS